MAAKTINVFEPTDKMRILDVDRTRVTDDPISTKVPSTITEAPAITNINRPRFDQDYLDDFEKVIPIKNDGGLVVPATPPPTNTIVPPPAVPNINSPQLDKDSLADFEKVTNGGGFVGPDTPLGTPTPNTIVPPPVDEGDTGTVEPVTSEVPKTTDAQKEYVQSTIDAMITDPRQLIADKNLEQAYTAQDIKPTEIQDPTKYSLDPTDPLTTALIPPSDPSAAAAAVQVEDFSAALINPNDLTKAIDEIAKLEPMKAASMAKHMDALLEGMEDGNVPVWARPAVAQVEQMLSARGISASSIGRDSLFNAIIQSAMPIAQQDASFEQDAYKTNYNAKVQAVLSDVNMEFAAKQFNANSINQTNQFKSQLNAQVAMQNASRQDAMTQFNAQMTSREGEFNASQTNSMVQMDAQLQSQREQFNANLSSQIEQSNVNWRRQVNQANTAGVNAVNQANVQNAFNLSNQALTFLWQEMRDEAHWEFQATESEKLRKAEKEMSLLMAAGEVGSEAGSTIVRLLEGSQFLADFLD